MSVATDGYHGVGPPWEVEKGVGWEERGEAELLLGPRHYHLIALQQSSEKPESPSVVAPDPVQRRARAEGSNS
jgi:hypothetical protein